MKMEPVFGILCRFSLGEVSRRSGLWQDWPFKSWRATSRRLSVKRTFWKHRSTSPFPSCATPSARWRSYGRFSEATTSPNTQHHLHISGTILHFLLDHFKLLGLLKAARYFPSDVVCIQTNSFYNFIRILIHFSFFLDVLGLLVDTIDLMAYWFDNISFVEQSNRSKGQRTVTFSKSDNKEKIKFSGGAADPPSHPVHSGTNGRRYPGGSNRQQNVKMEFQMNKVRLIILLKFKSGFFFFMVPCVETLDRAQDFWHGSINRLF